MKHLQGKTDEELNQMISVVVDVENMYVLFSREENPDTKNVSSMPRFLFFKNCLATFSISRLYYRGGG